MSLFQLLLLIILLFTTANVFADKLVEYATEYKSTDMRNIARITISPYTHMLSQAGVNKVIKFTDIICEDVKIPTGPNGVPLRFCFANHNKQNVYESKSLYFSLK